MIVGGEAMTPRSTLLSLYAFAAARRSRSPTALTVTPPFEDEVASGRSVESRSGAVIGVVRLKSSAHRADGVPGRGRRDQLHLR